jgi:hypothetical protein
MSAAQSATITVHHQPARSARQGTYLLAAVAPAVGSLAIAAVMTLSILLAAPATSRSAAPAPEPMPQPNLQVGLDR